MTTGSFRKALAGLLDEASRQVTTDIRRDLVVARYRRLIADAAVLLCRARV